MDTEKKESGTAIIQRSELDTILNALRENTAALVEIGIAVKKLENEISYILNKGAVRG